MIQRVDQYTLRYTDPSGQSQVVSAGDWAAFQVVYNVYEEQQQIEERNKTAMQSYLLALAPISEQAARGMPIGNPPTKPLRQVMDDQGNMLSPVPFDPPLPDPPSPQRTSTAGVGNIRNANPSDPQAQQFNILFGMLKDLSDRLKAKGI